MSISIQKPIVRWTIGNTTPDGYLCLKLSIESFLRLYNADVVILHNCDKSKIPECLHCYNLIDQKQLIHSGPPPMGVAWKLYPGRLDLNRYEISIDNDLIIHERIDTIDRFLSSNSVLLLEDIGRTYGRFQNLVRQDLFINSGLYGMPPQFDLQSYINHFGGKAWQKNAFGYNDSSETFDEQGLVALALSQYPQLCVVSKHDILDSRYVYEKSKGNHFIGLNRSIHHIPFRVFYSENSQIFL